jgi:4-oxalocrotonate tautomerase
MPFINVKMLEGRTHEQKKALVKAMTDAIVETCGAKAEGTMVVIEDIPRDHWARNGVLLSEQ